MTVDLDTVRHAAYDGKDWRLVALCVLKHPASLYAPLELLKPVARAGFSPYPTEDDFEAVRIASDALDRMEAADARR